MKEGEKAYREIFGETVVEREIRKSLERLGRGCADELNEKITGIIATEIRAHLERPDEIALACVVTDIIRALNEAGFKIIPENE